MSFESAPSETRHRGLILGIAVAAAVLLTAAQSSCQDRPAARGTSSSSLKAASGARVTYAVTANGHIASVSYTNGAGDIETDTVVGTGWTGSARMPTRVAHVELNAVAGRGTTALRCSITVGGKVVQEVSAVGPSAKVACAASVSSTG